MRHLSFSMLRGSSFLGLRGCALVALAALCTVALASCEEDLQPAGQKIVQYAPSQVAFGNVAEQSTATLGIVLTNRSQLAVEFDTVELGGADAGAFTITPGEPFSIDNGTSVTVTVQFAPTEIRAYQATLRLVSADELLWEELLPSGVTGASDRGTERTFNLTGAGKKVLPAKVETSVNTINFGSVTVGQEKEATVDFINYGEGELQITGYEIVGLAAAAYSVVTPATSALPVKVPGVSGSNLERTTFTLRFTPSGDGFFASTFLYVDTNDPHKCKGASCKPEGDTLFAFNCQQEGNTCRVGLSLTGQGTTGDLRLLPGNTLVFEDTPVGSTREIAATVLNVGQQDIDVTDVTIAGTGAAAFGAEFTAGAIDKVNGLPVTFTFTPPAGGKFEATFEIATTNGPLAGTLTGSARPCMQIEPAQHIFTAAPSASEAVTFTVTNLEETTDGGGNLVNAGCGADLSLTTISLDQSGASFVISGGNLGSGASLAPGASGTIEVTFTNNAGLDPEFATLDIAHNDPSQETPVLLPMISKDGGANLPPVAVPRSESGLQVFFPANSTLPVSIQLDGTQSVDPEGAALTYAWTVVSTPSSAVTATFDDATAARPKLLVDTNPAGGTATSLRGKYEIELVVTDDVPLSSAPQKIVIAIGVR